MNLRALLLFGLLLGGCSERGPAVPAPNKPTISSPIIAQASPQAYPGGRDAWLAMEGKIYNPNAVPITNVRVRWKVYETPPIEKDAAVWKEFGFEDSVEFDFAYIPAQTTYDFKSSKIKLRSKDVVRSMGFSEAPMTDLKPVIDFRPGT